MSIVSGTVNAIMRYVTASRDEPVVWFQRNKTTGFIIGGHFNPECGGAHHSFIDYLDEEDSEWEFICLQIKDSPALKRHLWNNYKSFEFLMQIHIGIMFGSIVIKDEAAKPRLTQKEAPCLYHHQTEIRQFEFVQPQKHTMKFKEQGAKVVEEILRRQEHVIPKCLR